MPTYSETDFQLLWRYNKYSYDPAFADNSVFAAVDRADSSAFHTQAVIWNGTATALADPAPPVGAIWSVAIDGNDSNAVGMLVVAGEETNSRSALWEWVAGQWILTLLPLPTNGVSASAAGISADLNMVVGEVSFSNGQQRGAVWIRVGSDWQTEILPSSTRSEATGSLGAKVVGYILYPRPGDPDVVDRRAAVWEKVNNVWVMSQLALPGGAPSTGTTTEAERVSGGLAVGSYSLAGAATQACYWDSTGAITAIPAGSSARALGHNNGRFVGASSAGGADTGFLWSANDGTIALTHSAYDWLIASGVDANGVVYGIAGVTNGNTVLFRWPPVQSLN